jgi:hypothetical protein
MRTIKMTKSNNFAATLAGLVLVAYGVFFIVAGVGPYLTHQA